LAEAHRVLRPGGRLLATFFILDSGPAPSLDFADRHPDYALLDATTHEAIAFPERVIRELLPESQWRMRIAYGGWAGSEGAPTFQDTVLAEKV
jgi:hypothetical protein